MKPSRALLLLVVTMLMMPGSSWPQEATGRITGTVSDPTGAVVPGVQITVTNTATEVSRKTTTNQDGYYQVLALPIGNYKVTAEHEGFRTVISDEYKLLINQTLRVDIALRVGATAQTIDVGAQAAAVETVNSTLGQSVTGRTLTNMPLNGRDMLDLALLQPGVTESNDDNGGAGNYSIAGGRTDSITYLLDGGQNNDLLDNSNLLDPNPDAVAEFRLLTSNYTAEYGRNGGGIISIVTKSGTNQLHGSLFEFFRNRVLDANDFFNIQRGLPRLDLKRNQYGATLGGPIVKDKIFFFLAYQGQRQVQAEPDISPVFTPLEVQGNFSQSGPNGTPDPNVAEFLQANPFFQPNTALAAQAIIAPNQINSVAQAYIKAGLIPSTPSGLLSTSLDAVDNRDELTSKFDFNLSGKDKLSATVGLNRQGDPYSGTLNPLPFASVPGFASRTEANYYFTNIGYTRIFSPTLLNEFHFVTHRSNYLSDTPANHLPTPAALGIGVTPDVPTGPTNLYFDTGLAIGNSENGPTRYVENTFSWTDAVTWTRGHHNWKFGAGFTPYQENLAYDFIINGEFDYYGPGGIGSGNSYADFLLGITYDYLQGAKAPSNIRQKNTYAFAQDEWHARKNLVLTLGLRYEYSTPKTDTEGRTFSIIPGDQSHRFVNAPTGLVFPGDPGAPTGSNFPDKTNFAPRFGFAWDPRGNGKTSVRGGFGVFYDILKAEDNLQFNGQAPFVGSAGLYFNPVGPGSGSVNYMNQPFVAAGIPNPFPSKPPASNISFVPFVPINSSGFVYFVDPHLRTPYIYDYNLSVQRNLFYDTVLEMNYVGTSSHGLTSLRDINPMILGTTTRVLDQLPGNSTCGTTVGILCFGQLPEFQNVANANYNALETSLTRQPKTSKLGTLYYTFAYTYAHNLDDASGFRQRNSIVPAYDPHLYYASSDSDVRQRISVSGGWDLPFDRMWTNGPKRLTKGWSLYPILTWRTGFPFDIGAALPGGSDPANPGTSGAGDPYLTNAAVVGPIQIFNPDHQRTINEISYGISPTGTCQITTTPLTGNFYFNPNSFSNVPLENSAYFINNSSTGVANPCFPSLDPVNNPADRTYGLHRNTLRGPGLTNLDIALAKTTAITERVSLEFRVEYFNVLNHPEFAQPTFGQGTTNI
ncbi:MAG TPA: carboxypeptidase regulatory-like domain-containing protein, partial [Terriglobales bacterium]|nr:carboxypeptidase regulatory-like domain-containing protein [Terriglobales bacterium]